MYHMYQYVAVCCTLLCHRLCTKITHFLLMHNIQTQSSQLFETYWCSFCTFIYVFWIILTEGDFNKSQKTSVRKYTAVIFTAYVYVVGCYVTFIISVHWFNTEFWYWVLFYVTCWNHNWIFYMEWHVIEFHNISISHIYIETEYCTWNGIWFNFRTSVYLTCILKQSIVHVVTCDTVSEHQYISHVYWKRILYMQWHVIQFQNISISHMYIETEYCTWSDMWLSFIASVYLACI